jgi:CheY-like chemotaxis protein
MQSANEAISILLIEDDEVDAEDVFREFKLLDVAINFYRAKNGVEALELLYGKDGGEKTIPTPKVIILDTNMPKMGGVEFLTKLREDSSFDGIKVFMLTGEYTTREKLATNSLRVSGRIVKPLQYEDVLNIYWSILGKPA